MLVVTKTKNPRVTLSETTWGLPCPSIFSGAAAAASAPRTIGGRQLLPKSQSLLPNRILLDSTTNEATLPIEILFLIAWSRRYE